MIIALGTIYFIYVLVKLYISFLELNYVKKAKDFAPIILSKENYKKAAEYKIKNEQFNILSNLYDYALFLIWIFFGLHFIETLIISNGGILQSTIYVLCFLFINYLLSLPFDVYSTFVKDKQFGFTTIDIKTYFQDQIMSMIMLIIFGGIIIALISYIIINVQLWWFFGFLAIFSVILFINIFYPTIIAPIFNKFKPLENSELKSSIEILMSKAGLNSSGIFTMDASKRDKRLNAYFGGLGKSKRVVLFDTLIEKLETKELLAVLGHELGHFKNKDILKNIATIAFMLFILFAIFGNIPFTFYTSIGINSAAYSIVVMFLLLSPVISFFMMPIFGWISRKNEYAADKYGSECESKEALVSALMKLADENKSFPRSHPFYIIFHHTHPPLVDRLVALGFKNESKENNLWH